ncbi:GNAT family N-acetyltransferase [Plastorhodobacter daqingensis]|uniref:L-ornithine N(alpha)-acyltransferase n=1 Tax=Plastorhodobacter daqingensis TaxID=1387281 RepID=A0ABW2UIS6_9RHOB
MLALARGRFTARFAESAEDIEAAQALRHQCFVTGRGLPARPGMALERDGFDASCRHLLVEHVPSGVLVCCFRLLMLEGGGRIGDSYSAQYYELSALAAYPGRMAELGRFCIHPDWRDPDILRIAWAALARVVDEEGIELLFGCSSFNGTDGDSYRDAFALLARNHMAPDRWQPRVKAPDVFRFGRLLRQLIPDPGRAMRAMPPLLRSYLAMGGWVSDHAVVDRDLATLHVFTGLEIGAIPPARARLLRATATA